MNHEYKYLQPGDPDYPVDPFADEPDEETDLTADERDLITGLLATFILHTTYQMRPIPEADRQEYLDSISLAHRASFKLGKRK